MAILCLTGSLLCYSSVPLFIKHFSSFLDAWTVNGVRYLTASVVLALPVFMILKKNPEMNTVWKAAIFPGAVNLCGQIGWALTPYYSDASVIGFNIRVSFLFTLVFGFFMIPGERPLIKSSFFWAGAVVCITGVIMMYSASIRNGSETSLTGMTIIAVTAVFWGLYSVVVKRNMGGFPARLSFGVISLYTTFGLLVLMLLRGNTSSLKTLELQQWSFLVVSGLIGIASAHVLLYKALAVLGPVTCGGASLLSPFLTWLGAAILLGEKMTLTQTVGGMVIIFGAFLLVRAQAVTSKASVQTRQTFTPR
ncbi:DMT family transporter [Verrucomicrobiota bacterium]